MQVLPHFVLLDCGVRFENGKNTLWRRYTLSTEGFVCDITEVFPDRDMFILGERWLDDVTKENSKLGYATNTVLDGIYLKNPTKLSF